jgi:hypothetical protein
MFRAKFRGTYVSSNSTKVHYEIVEKETGEAIGNALVTSELDEDGEMIVTSDNLGTDVWAAFDEAYGLEADENFTASFDFDLPLLVEEPSDQGEPA